jgi:hypothetical protein
VSLSDLRCRGHIPVKRWLIFSGLDGVILSQKIKDKALLFLCFEGGRLV